LPADRNHSENIATAITEVSERMTVLVRDEIELAKAEVGAKFSSLARGTAAVAAGAVFGVFAVIFGLETIAWALDDVFVPGTGNLYLGFLIVFGLLLLMALGAFIFAWRKLRVGAPTPKMAIDEAKLIRETVATRSQDGS
jgi:Putative Actinobacterial Holin-X, holin superfamily III